MADEAEGRPMTHQERVVLERNDLAPMVDRLHSFVNGASFESVGPEEQQLLKAQLGAMQSYLNALNARIKLHRNQA